MGVPLVIIHLSMDFPLQTKNGILNFWTPPPRVGLLIVVVGCAPFRLRLGETLFTAKTLANEKWYSTGRKEILGRAGQPTWRKRTIFHLNMAMNIWRFPKMGVSKNHGFISWNIPSRNG